MKTARKTLERALLRKKLEGKKGIYVTYGKVELNIELL